MLAPVHSHCGLLLLRAAYHANGGHLHTFVVLCSAKLPMPASGGCVPLGLHLDQRCDARHFAVSVPCVAQRSSTHPATGLRLLLSAARPESRSKTRQTAARLCLGIIGQCRCPRGGKMAPAYCRADRSIGPRRHAPGRGCYAVPSGLESGYETVVHANGGAYATA